MCFLWDLLSGSGIHLCALLLSTWPLEALLKGLNGLEHYQLVSAWNQTLFTHLALPENSMRMYALPGNDNVPSVLAVQVN